MPVRGGVLCRTVRTEANEDDSVQCYYNPHDLAQPCYNRMCCYTEGDLAHGAYELVFILVSVSYVHTRRTPHRTLCYTK